MAGNGDDWQEASQVGLVSHGTLLGLYLLFPEKMLDGFVPPWLYFFKDPSGCYVKGGWSIEGTGEKGIRRDH